MLCESRHLREHYGMCRSRGTAANDLRSNRQVKADYAVLEEADSITRQHLSRNASDGEEKKGSGPLRVFHIVQPFRHGDFDWDVLDLPWKAVNQGLCEFPLTTENP